MLVIRAVLVALVLLGGYLVPGSGAYITLPAAIVAALVLLWEVTRQLPKLHPIMLFLVLVFGLLSVHRLFSEPVLQYGEQKFFSFLTAVLFSAAIASLISLPNGFAPLAVTWVVIGLYLSFASILSGNSLRANVFESNPIWVARAMAAGFVLLVWLYWTKRVRLVFMLIIGVTLLLGIFATGSRGPLVAAIAGTVVILIASKVKVGKKVLALAFSSFGAFVLLRLPPFSESRIVGILTGEIADSTTRERMWHESLAIITAHPFGVGYGNWAEHTSYNMPGLYPHNLFLEVFVEHGVIVGTVFILIVAIILLSCLQSSRHSEVALGVAAWLVTEIVHVSVSGDLKAPIFFFTLALAFLVVAYRKSAYRWEKGGGSCSSVRGATINKHS